MDIESRVGARAARLPQGDKVLEIVRSDRMRRMILRSAEAGEVPLECAATELTLRHPDLMALLPYRQLAGLAVAAVMASAGYEVALARKRIPGTPPFRFGATYRKTGPADVPGLVERLVAAFDDDEAREARRLLDRRLGTPGSGSR